MLLLSIPMTLLIMFPCYVFFLLKIYVLKGSLVSPEMS